MKMSATARPSSKGLSGPGSAVQNDLFVLVIDREKMVEQLLEAVQRLGLPLEKQE